MFANLKSHLRPRLFVLCYIYRLPCFRFDLRLGDDSLAAEEHKLPLELDFVHLPLAPIDSPSCPVTPSTMGTSLQNKHLVVVDCP